MARKAPEAGNKHSGKRRSVKNTKKKKDRQNMTMIGGLKHVPQRDVNMISGLKYVSNFTRQMSKECDR